jgi:hypothetical protein
VTKLNYVAEPWMTTVTHRLFGNSVEGCALNAFGRRNLLRLRKRIVSDQ